MRLENRFEVMSWASKIKWSNDSQKVAISNYAGGISLYSRDLVLLDFLQGYIERVLSLAWSSNNNNLIFSHVMNTDRSDLAQVKQSLLVWDVIANELKYSLYTHPNHFVSDVAWNTDGTKLAGALSSNAIIVWDASGEELVQLEGQTNYSKMLIWLDENHLASLDYDNTVRIWNIETGAIPYSGLSSDFSGIIHIDVASSGNVLLGMTLDGLIRVWDVANELSLKHPKLDKDKILSTYWMDDGNYIVGINRNGAVIVWNTKDGERYASLTASCSTLAIHPNSPVVAFACKDGSAALWNVLNNHVQPLLDANPHKITSLDWSPDGTRLIGSINGNGLWLWNTSENAKAIVMPDVNRSRLEGLSSVSLHASKQRLLQGFEYGKYVILDIDADSSQVLTLSHQEPLYTAKWSNDGERYVLGGYYGSIDIFKTDEKTPLRSDKLAGSLHYLDWKPDDSKLVGFLSSHKTSVPNFALIINPDLDEVKRFEVNTSICAWSLDTSKFASIQMSQESFDSLTLQIYRMDGSSAIQPLPTTIKTVSTMKWQPDNRHICIATIDGNLYVWDTNNEDLVARVEGHFSSINTVAWHPSRALVASGGRDHKVAIWDVPSQKQLHRYFHPSQITALEWSSEGTKLIVASLDGTISIWVDEA